MIGRSSDFVIGRLVSASDLVWEGCCWVPAQVPRHPIVRWPKGQIT
jgi:hypothetical protein